MSNDQELRAKGQAYLVQSVHDATPIRHTLFAYSGLLLELPVVLVPDDIGVCENWPVLEFEPASRLFNTNTTRGLACDIDNVSVVHAPGCIYAAASGNVRSPEGPAAQFPSSEIQIPNSEFAQHSNSDLQLIVLGIAQDGGYPQAGCQKKCCKAAWLDPTRKRWVSSVAVVDRTSGQRWVFDCSPDFRDQLALLDKIAPVQDSPGISGILLTHAHIGHYTGLMHLGREAMGTKGIPVYAMPRMRAFLTENGPWSQLVKLDNIHLKPLVDGKTIKLSPRLAVTPFMVPHRDEFSETVGFKIQSNQKTVAYLPDIDKWSRWNQSIEQLIENVEIAYLDGTFFSDGELPGRNMSLIPHPFVQESIN